MGRYRSLCRECDRPIVAFRRGRHSVFSPGPDHDLCQRCWKSETDRSRRVEPVEISDGFQIREVE